MKNFRKKFETKRGLSTVRVLLLICIIIALLIFFKATSLEEIKDLFITLGQGAVAVLKTIWDQFIMPVVNFFLVILSRLTSK